ncbi:MAG: glycosyltransferase [Desulfobacterota bacterium]|nr:glycosyltransferase [Thermodesulfobacteriota bacterium]
MTSAPRISVIVPTCNRPSFLMHALESIRRQTFTDYEIIVVDDGDNDVTHRLLEPSCGERFLYLHTNRRGLAAARNIGMQAARGHFFAFLDDDDQWLPGKLSAQIAVLERCPEVALVHCGYRIVNDNDKPIKEVRAEARKWAYQQLLAWNSIAASSVILRSEAARTSGGFDEQLSGCADWDLWLRIARDHPIEYCDEILTLYRIHGNNMHKNIAGMERETFLILEKHAMHLAREQYTSLRATHAVRLARDYYRVGNRAACLRLLTDALLEDPTCSLLMHELSVEEQEHLIGDALSTLRSAIHDTQQHRTYQRAAAKQYHLLAWVYYHQNRMADFRRCLRNVFQYRFPHIPFRLLVPYLKSFFGKRVSDALHTLRTRLTNKHAGFRFL